MTAKKQTAIASTVNNLTGATKSTAFVLPPESYELTIQTVKADNAVSKKWQKLAEDYVSKGVIAMMLDKPKKGMQNKFEDLHNQINSAIRAGFDESVQKLFLAEPKTLNQDQRGVRNLYWNQHTASYFNKIRKHILNLESGDKASTPKTPKTHSGKAIEALESAKAEIQKIEAPNFDVTLAVKSINTLIASIKS